MGISRGAYGVVLGDLQTSSALQGDSKRRGEKMSDSIALVITTRKHSERDEQTSADRGRVPDQSAYLTRQAIPLQLQVAPSIKVRGTLTVKQLHWL